MSHGEIDGRIPRKIIPEIVMFFLNQNGKTIKQIQDNRNRKYQGDESQKEHQDKPVWHTRKDLIISVAKKLKLRPNMWGPDRISSDFEDAMDLEITKIRKKGIVEEWNKTKHYGIWRLVKPIKQSDTPIRNIDERISASIGIQQIEVTDLSDANLKRVFHSILTKGMKSNTYKFALARSLLEYCQEHRGDTSKSIHEIPYQYLADKFLKIYWHQEYKFRIKQDFSINTRPKVITAIRDVFGDNTLGDFRHLHKEDKLEAQEKIIKTVFGSAKLKTSNVVPRFQNIRVGNSTEKKKVFYDYDDDEKKIYLKHEAFEFFNKNYAILSMAVLAEWAKFLEKINTSLPRLVAKIERDDMKRGSLVHFRKTYLEHTEHCFYCATKLERNYIDVDHFIPWSYIFDDDAWNLVLACQECNRKKSNSLAKLQFQDELIRRNTKYYAQIGILEKSLKFLDKGKGWETEIKNHYDNCREYGFNIIHLP